ncbi:MAG: hypothetical protein ACM3PE_09205 [Deltaproteobacteria bacterium]
MNRGSRYEAIIKALPWENGGRDMAPQIIATAVIRENRELLGTARPSFCHLRVSPVIIGLALTVLLLAYGGGGSTPQQLRDERIGSNTLALWTQTAHGFRVTLGK